MQNNDIYNELHTNFIEYAYAVNSDRAIPSAADGLKPVAKRILYSCLMEGRTYSKPHVKAARIVGDVMGKLHPHGDSSIYGAMVRLSQNWVMRYPLIDWHGNNGNIVGDGLRKMRLNLFRTMMRLWKNLQFCLRDFLIFFVILTVELASLLHVLGRRIISRKWL